VNKKYPSYLGSLALWLGIERDFLKDQKAYLIIWLECWRSSPVSSLQRDLLRLEFGSVIFTKSQEGMNYFKLEWNEILYFLEKSKLPLQEPCLQGNLKDTFKAVVYSEKTFVRLDTS